MPSESPFPEVEIAVVLIQRGESLLLVWNPKWASFTFPMTKRRVLPGGTPKAKPTAEPLAVAAARALAEVMACTVSIAELKPLDLVVEFQQSDRDGDWKRYKFIGFTYNMPAGAPLAPGVIGEWLTPRDIQDKKREPISKTARDLMGRFAGKL